MSLEEGYKEIIDLPSEDFDSLLFEMYYDPKNFNVVSRSDEFGNTYKIGMKIEYIDVVFVGGKGGIAKSVFQKIVGEIVELYPSLSTRENWIVVRFPELPDDLLGKRRYLRPDEVRIIS
jgi:hypothetical protein